MKMCFWGCLLSIAWTMVFINGSAARADLVIFNLGGALNGTSLDGVASGTLTVNGLTATLTASDGLLNATSANFGVNATGPGDATDLLDAGSGTPEFISVSFDQSVTFTQITLGAFSGSERASLTLGLNPTLTLEATTAAADIYDFTASDFPLGNLLAPGQTVRIGYSFGSAADNGFSLQGFQVQTVPEPSIWGCIGPLLLGGLFRRRRETTRTLWKKPLWNASVAGDSGA
jgi:hypothetical protein